MQLHVDVVGRTPLWLHNPESLANPMSPLSQQIKTLTSKRKKTTEDHKAIAQLEFEGGLYWDKKLGVVVPSWNVQKCLIEAARLRRLGKGVERGAAILDGQNLKLAFKGESLSVDELWEARANPDDPDSPPAYWRSVTMGQRGNRITRTRPYFEEWSLSFDLAVVDTQLDRHEAVTIIEEAGSMIGLGDSRNMGFGRFDATITITKEPAE